MGVSHWALVIERDRTLLTVTAPIKKPSYRKRRGRPIRFVWIARYRKLNRISLALVPELLL
jgi:hypothetical protein